MKLELQSHFAAFWNCYRDLSKPFKRQEEARQWMPEERMEWLSMNGEQYTYTRVSSKYPIKHLCVDG